MKCKSCKEEFEPLYRNGILMSKLCIKCLSKKGAKIVDRNDKKILAEKKKSLKKHSEWLNELQPLINKIARLIDYGQPCIARQNLMNENGGHYKTCGGNGNIRFNLHNIFGQSITSNKYRGGEPLLMREGLIRVYGKEYCDYVDSLNVLYPKLNASTEDIKEAILKARKVVRELESSLRIYSASERIELRTKYNKEIGLYK